MSSSGISMSQWPSDHRYTLPVADGPDEVTITVDGKELVVPRGELLIKAVQDHGTYIPRFCWHERMKPVGMCRMCLVEIEGMRGLQISCATPVAEGMVVSTQSEGVQQAQDGVLEFLLINHPLDCPVCDRGGECPLQDQTLAFGPGESRFVEEKRHFEKPIPISDLVLLDRERCIQCGRCTRFAAEVAGDPLIDFGGRGGETEVITYPDEPFTSYFSGNTVQICPVGALTASSYRFKARPWDLASVETSCTTCAVGCRATLDSTSNRLVRLLGVDSEPVNHGWLCDKGRYGYEWVHSDARLRTPLVRQGDALVDASWPEALDAAAQALRGIADRDGPEAVAVLGGAELTNEDAYVWARLAKDVLGTDHVDAQLGDGLPADVVLGMPRATIADLDRARAIVLLGPDLKEELPVLHLRVLRAAQELGVPLVDVAARDHGLTRAATTVLRHAPGSPSEVVDDLAAVLGGTTSRTKELAALGAAIAEREGPVVVVLGRPSVAESADGVIAAASTLAGVGDVRFLSALHHGNVHGALDAGLAPGFLPGRVSIAAGGDHVKGTWRRVPEAPGLDAAGILAAAADGRVKALVLLDCDPVADFPDRDLARRAMAAVECVVSVTAFPDTTTVAADVVLPPTVWGEQAGSATNLEGRVQRLGRRVTPDGSTMEPWRMAAELAIRLGTDFDLETVPEVQDELARVAPAFAGVDAALLRRARDGVVLPASEHLDELTLGAGPLGVGLSWEPIPPQPEEPAADDSPAEDAPADDTPAEPAIPGPAVALHTWTGGVAAGVPTPMDAYSLRLVAGRTLFGSDRVTAATPALAKLGGDVAALLVHPKVRDRLGVEDGTAVRVISPRGTVELPVRSDPAMPLGVAFVATNRSGPGAADLVDATAAITDVRVETIS